MDRTGPKLRWAAGEMELLAAAEDRLGNTSRINQKLHQEFPDRTLEAIKGMRRQPKYKALLARSRVREAVAPVENPPSTEAERGAGPLIAEVMSPPPSPDNIQTDAILTPERGPNDRWEGTDDDREEDEIVRDVLNIPATASPSSNPQSEDASLPSGDDGGSAPNLFDSTESFTNNRIELKEALLVSLDCFVGLDAMEIVGFEPDQLSAMEKRDIDTEYSRWIQQELEQGGRRKGPRRRARRREAVSRDSEAAGPAEAMGRRKRMRAQYARVQKAYHRNRTECARKVLSGEWEEGAAPTIPLGDQVRFWSEVFGAPSRDDERTTEPIGRVMWDLLTPIRLEEILATLRKSKDGAAGTDRISRDDMRKLDPRALQAHFNLWLYAGYQPAEFRHSRTVLIPKVAVPLAPEEFRPIAISSFVSRVFHRLLAERLSALLEFQSRQKAFVKGDGLADNVFLLRSLIRDRCEGLKPLCLAFLDVRKAFDTVSHATLIKAATRMGIPMPFISYLRNLYTEATTSLHVDGKFSDPLPQNRGVKQGDPLSPLLFNCVIDWALDSLDPAIGLSIGQSPTKLNHLAFADDVVLIAEYQVGIQDLTAHFERALLRCGLTLNAKKSNTLRIAINGKRKQWLCDPVPFVGISGGVLPAISITNAYKYLGVAISARERDSKPEELLTRGLNHLTRAPLKPQQRMFMLINNLLPKLYHRLVLSRIHGGVLRRMDKIIRKNIKNWLRLPHDCTNSYIYSEAKEGGLGVPSVRITIPCLKSKRMVRLTKSSDSFISAMSKCSGTFRKELARCHDPPIKVGQRTVYNRETAAAAWSEMLTNSADGYGLVAHKFVPYIHGWVTDGTQLLYGANYIHAVQIRGATVATRSRAARGRPLAVVRCDCCGRTDTLGHVLQTCPRTWGPRIKRHDALMEKYLLKMENRGWQVVRAPVIPVRGGSPQIPDGVLYKEGTWWVVDASVVADNVDLDDAFMSKCTKYDIPAVRDWCQSHWPSPGGSLVNLFGALIFNWRGAMSARSAIMCTQMGITKGDLKVFSVCVVEWGWRIYRHFHKGTARY